MSTMKLEEKTDDSIITLYLSQSINWLTVALESIHTSNHREVMDAVTLVRERLNRVEREAAKYDRYYRTKKN